MSTCFHDLLTPDALERFIDDIAATTDETWWEDDDFTYLNKCGTTTVYSAGLSHRDRFTFQD